MSGHHDTSGSVDDAPSIGREHRPAIETTVLAEFLHRTCNDYGAVLAALQLAASHVSGPAAGYLEQAAIRIRAAARLHRTMIPPLVSGRTDVSERLEECCRGIVETRDPSSRIRLVLAAEPLLLDATTAWMITAVAAELIRNAERHAFRGESGDVVVTLRETSGSMVLAVCDNGGGAGDWVSRRGGAGGPIVDAVAGVLGAVIRRTTAECGTIVEMTVPMRESGSAGGMRLVAA